jgi:peroxiredoxin
MMSSPTETMTATTAREALRPGGRLSTALVVAVTAVLIVVAAVVVNQPADSSVTGVTLTGDTSGEAPRVGGTAPDFKAMTVEGTAVSLSDYSGQPVWLTFGASWCGDCRAEAPDLEATYAKYEAQGLVVLGVFINEDAKAVSAYASRVGFTFPMVADPQTQIASRYRTMGIPTHYFIDRTGTIREIRLGGLQPQDMDALVEQLLAY